MLGHHRGAGDGRDEAQARYSCARGADLHNCQDAVAPREQPHTDRRLIPLTVSLFSSRAAAKFVRGADELEQVGAHIGGRRTLSLESTTYCLQPEAGD